MRTSTRYLAVLIATIAGLVTAFMPLGAPTTIKPQSLLPCAHHQCQPDIVRLSKTFIEKLETTNDTSVALKESSLAIGNSLVAIRNTSLSLRDPPPLLEDPQATTTTTVTTPLVTSTMSSAPLTPPINVVFSTTIPWGPGSSTSIIDSVATILNGSRHTTTTNIQDSTISAKPAPSITSPRSVVASNHSTTISTTISTTTRTTVSIPSSNNSSSVTISNSVLPFCNGTCVPVVTSYSLTTIDVSGTMISATRTSANSTEAPAASNTGFVQNSGQDFMNAYHRAGIAMVIGLIVDTVLVGLV